MNRTFHLATAVLVSSVFSFAQTAAAPTEQKQAPPAASSDQKQQAPQLQSPDPCAVARTSSSYGYGHSGDYGIGVATSSTGRPPTKSGVKVTISPRPTMQVPIGSSEVVTARVAGTANDAVTWSITGLGCSGADCGTVHDGVYLAPTILPIPPSVKLTATSEADPSASDSVTACIVQPDSSQNRVDSSKPLSPAQGIAQDVLGNGSTSQGSAIEQAARAAAANRGGYGGEGGKYGLGLGKKPETDTGPIEILTDPRGVDFGPYLHQIVLPTVRKNWLNLIPESARAPLMMKGKVTIEFAILKDGTVAGMRLVSPSGDVTLDRAAWGGITASSPFPPLPSEFSGSYLRLRFTFYYNPDQADLIMGPLIMGPLASPTGQTSSKSGMKVSISPTDGGKVPIGGFEVVDATVTGSTNTAVKWSVSGSGCADSACGTVSGDLYLAPKVLPGLPSVELTATSKADPTATASVMVQLVAEKK